MLLSGPVFVLLLNGFYDNTDDSKKVLVRISILFAVAYSILSSLHYFIQIGAVRLNVINENFEGIEYFLQANPLFNLVIYCYVRMDSVFGFVITLHISGFCWNKQGLEMGIPDQWYFLYYCRVWIYTSDRCIDICFCQHRHWQRSNNGYINCIYKAFQQIDFKGRVGIPGE